MWVFLFFFWHRCWRNSTVCAQRWGIRLQNGRVPDSWSKVRHLSVFISRWRLLWTAILMAGYLEDWDGFGSREQCGLNRALRAGKTPADHSCGAKTNTRGQGRTRRNAMRLRFTPDGSAYEMNTTASSESLKMTHFPRFGIKTKLLENAPCVLRALTVLFCDVQMKDRDGTFRILYARGRQQHGAKL